jgi:hypothetical protein
MTPPDRVKDLAGQRFGHLLVLDFSHTCRKHAYWRVRCDCGTEKVIRGSNITTHPEPRTVSCGCRGREASRENMYRLLQTRYAV